MKRALCSLVGRPILAGLAAALVLVPAGVAVGSPAPTKLLNGNFIPNHFVVRPARILLPPPLRWFAFVLAGSQGPRPGRWRGHMQWDSWHTSHAYGSATEWAESFVGPYGDPGPWHKVGVATVRAWRPVAHRFTRMTIKGPRMHKTWKLRRGAPERPGQWYWSLLQ